MKTLKLFAMLALLGMSGLAQARENVVIERWPTGRSNVRSATEFTAEGYGGEGGTGAAISMQIFNGSTVYDMENSKTGATLYIVTAAAFLDNKIVLPFTLMGMDPKNVSRVLVRPADGTTTNFCYIGWSMSNNGHGATAAAFTGREILYGGAAASAAVVNATGVRDAAWDNPNLNNTANTFGTIYIATADVLAQGIQNLRIRVEAR